jgi:hypothetical protein
MLHLSLWVPPGKSMEELIRNMSLFIQSINLTNKLFIVIILVLVVMIVQKHLSYRSWSRYNFAVAHGAPYLYPVRTINTGIILENKELFFENREDNIQIPISGWKESFESKPSFEYLPAKINLDWYSIRDRKFYQGSFELTKARRDSIVNLFESDSRKKKQFSDDFYIVFSIGYEPGGVATVWIAGENFRYESDRFHANEYIPASKFKIDDNVWLNKKEFADLLFNNLDSLQKAEIENGVPAPSDFWQLIRKRYNYTLEINCTAEIKDIIISYFNSEEEVVTGKKVNLKEKSLIRELVVGISDKSAGKTRRKKIIFTDDEIINLFEKLQSEGKSVTISINLENDVKISLTNGLQSVFLTKYKVSR